MVVGALPQPPHKQIPLRNQGFLITLLELRVIVRRLTADGDLDVQLHGRATGARRTAVVVLHRLP
jgi:hypothetical protein